MLYPLCGAQPRHWLGLLFCLDLSDPRLKGDELLRDHQIPGHRLADPG